MEDIVNQPKPAPTHNPHVRQDFHTDELVVDQAIIDLMDQFEKKDSKQTTLSVLPSHGVSKKGGVSSSQGKTNAKQRLVIESEDEDEDAWNQLLEIEQQIEAERKSLTSNSINTQVSYTGQSSDSKLVDLSTCNQKSSTSEIRFNLNELILFTT